MAEGIKEDKLKEALETVKRKLEEKGHAVKVGLFSLMAVTTMGHAYASENKNTPDNFPTDSVSYNLDNVNDYFSENSGENGVGSTITLDDALKATDHSNKIDEYWNQFSSVDENYDVPDSIANPAEEENVPTFAQTYEQVKDHPLNDLGMTFVKRGLEISLEEGGLTVGGLTAEHAVQVGNTLEEEEVQNLEPSDKDAYSAAYAQLYQNMRSGQLDEGQLNTVKTGIQHGFLSIDTLEGAHAVQVANSLSQDEQNSWGQQKMQALADVYIASHNQTFDKCQGGNPDLLADALNGPLGKMCMAQEGGISLNIAAAEYLVENGKVNLGQLGTTQDAFLTKALNDTYEKLPSKISRMAPGDERSGAENMLIDRAYKYSQDASNTYLGNMNDGTSSTMGRYALQKVFKDKDGKDFTPADKMVLDNVTQDIIRNQDNMVAIGNYDRLCVEFANRSPEYYKALSATWRSNPKALSQYEQTQEGLSRAYLIGCLNNIHNPHNLDKSKTLASHQSVLQQCEVRACESQKYLAIYDLSVAYDYAANSVKSGDFGKINVANMNGRGYTNEVNQLENYTQRQKDFVLYMKYKGMENANKTGDAGYNTEEMKRIENQYGADFLAKAYKYVEAIHSKNAKALGSAKQALYDNDNLIVPTEYSKNAHKKGVYSTNDLRSNLKIQSDKYIKADSQWNNIVDKILPRGLGFSNNTLGNNISSDRVQAEFAAARAKIAGGNGGESTTVAQEGSRSQQAGHTLTQQEVVQAAINARISSEIKEA